jgi:putative ABC transport system permease protein
MRRMHFDTGSFDGHDPGNVILLAGIALAVLLIAGINFVNLSIGRAAGRTVEVGVRKAIGATRRQVLVQFWSESLLMIAGALAVGLALAALILPPFNLLSGKVLALKDFFSAQAVLIMLGLLVAVAAASGSYPAAVMSRVQPAAALKGRPGAGGKSPGRRGPAKWLVVVQFSLSVFLMLLTVLLGRQVRYMTGRDTGFAKEGLVRIGLQTETDEEAFRLLDRFKAQAAAYPGIASIGAANNSFGRGSGRFPLEHGGKKTPVYHYRVDPGYIETVGLTIVRGRNFEQDRGADKNGVIVNEAFCRMIGVADPVGRTIGDLIQAPTDSYPNRLLVIGVVRDYNFLSLREELQPVLLHAQKGWGLDNLYVRVREADVAGTMAFLERTWKELRPDKPFSYTFVQDDVASQYASEKRWNAIIRVSSAFALVIACMGVFGLTLLAVNRRYKEIGIRKVLGAGTDRIVGLVTGEFLFLAAAANIVAWPAAYLVVRGVLVNYAYRIRPTVFDFLLAGALATAVALGTTLSLAVKAALADPVASIRYE